MRALLFSLCLALALPAAAAPIGEADTARPGGVFSAIPAADPAACALACAEDSLCMAWTLRPAPENICELKAVIPAPRPERGAVSGLSPNAPAFARLIAPPAPVSGLRGHQAPVASPAMTQESAAEGELLGGPLAPATATAISAPGL